MNDKNIASFHLFVITLSFFGIAYAPNLHSVEPPFRHFLNLETGAVQSIGDDCLSLPQSDYFLNIGSVLKFSDRLHLKYSIGSFLVMPSTPVYYRLQRGTWGFPLSLSIENGIGSVQYLRFEFGASFIFAKYLNTDLSFLACRVFLTPWIRNGGRIDYGIGFPFSVTFRSDNIALGFGVSLIIDKVPTQFDNAWRKSHTTKMEVNEYPQV